MRTRLITTVFAFALLCGSAAAQQHPNNERGFQPDKVYQYENIDSVNLFNGNVTMSLPIGGSYPLDGGMAYGLTLSYNSKVWDYKDVTWQGEQYSQAIPNRRSNAGMGWLLSLGKIYAPQTPTNPGFQWEYEAADGSTHHFYKTLHPGGPEYPDCSLEPWNCPEIGTLDVGYTIDSSYLRMKLKTDGTRWVEFPDGTIHVFSNFSGDWRITQIRNQLLDGVYGNPTVYVNISYPATPPAACSGASMTWQLTDKHNRTQYVCFRNKNYPASVYSGNIVDKIVLQAFPTTAEPQRTSVYSFQYDNGATLGSVVARGCNTTDPNASENVTVPLLTKITMPDGSSFDMTYRQTYDLNNCSQGAITSATLPTLGKLLWTYRIYLIPGKGCGQMQWAAQTPGVATRQRVDTAGNDLGTWTYSTQLSEWGDQIWCEAEPLPFLGSQPAEEMKTTVTSPRGDRVVHYFSVWPENHAAQPDHGFRVGDYGLPFTKMTPEPNALGSRARHLSTQTFVAGSNTPIRSTYVAYERQSGSGPCTEQPNCDQRNRRIVSERTIYHDDGDRSSYTDYDRFDGLGNFRRETSSGTFGNDVTRVKVTNYNPGQADYVIDANGYQQGSYTMLPFYTPWVLKTYDSITLTEGSRTVKTQFCFDTNTGLLLRTRALTGSSPGTYDVLRVFTYDLYGNMTSERDYGAESGPLNDFSANLCDAYPNGLPAEQYRIDHTYSTGVITSSRYIKADGTPMPFYTKRQDVDARTGLVSWAYDVSGLGTQFLYDTMARVTSIRPEQGSRTDFTFANAFGSTPATVSIFARSNSGGTTLKQSKLFFDALGRPYREERLLPGGWAEKTTAWNKMGQKESESEWQMMADLAGGQPVRKTTFAYDAFGRQTVMTPPDGVAHRVTSSYAGTRVVTTTIGNTDPNAGPLGGIVTSGTSIWDLAETASSSTSTSDVFGRLVSVTEPSGPNGSAVTTNYAYAFEDHLSQVQTAAEGVVQTRTFTIDNRGLTTSEYHPESGNTWYSLFDAKGHPRRKDTGTAELVLTYDRAERLTGISQEWVGWLKEFFYDRPNNGSDRSVGKLDYSIRHNYHALLGGDVTVRETFTYAGVEGRISAKKTTVSTGQTFTDAYTYNDLGLPLSVTYPQCIGCGGAGPPRTVTNDYQQGMLTRVAGYTSPWSLIEYHPTAMVKSVTRMNADGSEGPVDTVAADPHGMPRPGSITVSRFCDNFNFSPEPADKTVITGSPANVSTSANGATSYQWYRGSSGNTADPISGQTTSTLTSTVEQTGTYWVRAGNGMCTIDSRTVTVTAQSCSAPNATISTVGSIYASGSASASVPVQSGATYAWSISNGTITSGASTSTITYTAGCSGNVTLSVTVTASCGTQSNGSRTVPISVPTATVSGSTVIDAYQPTQLRVDFTGTAPWSVTWSDGATNSFSSTPGYRQVSPGATTTYTVTSVTGANGCPGTASGSATIEVRPNAPANVVATANSNSQITVTWTASSNASSYVVYRRYNNVGWQPIITVSQSTLYYVDTGLPANVAYAYLVHAVSSSGTESHDSNTDIATTIVFDDDPVTVGTLVRANHIYQLRTAVNAVRATAGYAATTFTDSNLAGVRVRAVHIQELRNALAPARTALNLPAVSFNDDPLQVGMLIRAVHITQLRGGVK